VSNKRIVYELIVVGAGGTGTYFLKEISRFLTGEGGKSVSSIHIFDGDIVEEKNLLRQCFVSEDVGRNKAAVMAEVLGDAFSLKVTAHDSYLLSTRQLSEFAYREYYDHVVIPLLVGCVDNHAARLVLEEFFQSQPSAVLFDAGNEFSSGEVVYSYRMNKISIGPTRSHYFPDVRKGDLRNREEMSCEELNNVSPQHIFTNMMAGNLLCSGVANLILEKKVTPGFVYFNSLGYESGFVPYMPSKKAERKGA